MIERGEYFRLTLEPGQPFRIGGHHLGEHLQGDGPLQIRVGGLVDLAHSTGANLRGDFVDTKTAAGEEGQVAWIIRARPNSRAHSYFVYSETCARLLFRRS